MSFVRRIEMKPSVREGACLVAPLFLLVSALFSQTSPDLNRIRQVRGQTLFSPELPNASLTVGKEFHYVGGQRVNLYGNADAEQHVFVTSGDHGVVQRFYWIQFEHFLPSNTHTYDYAPTRTVEIGGLTFVYDAKSWPQYKSMQAEDAGSDGAAIEKLLEQHGLSFPARTVRVRMFHLPAPDHRSELMIIYGEALPDQSSVPVRADGVQLDAEAPDAAKMYLKRAMTDLRIVVAGRE